MISSTLAARWTGSSAGVSGQAVAAPPVAQKVDGRTLLF
jgi:hypothetical protein